METPDRIAVADDNKQFLEQVRRSREEEARFFSNAAKSERERWVAREFLTALGVAFGDSELSSPRQDDSVDVLFRTARFQVKEVVDSDVPRGDEVAAAVSRARKARSVADLFEPASARDIVLMDLGAEIFDRASLPKYPPRDRSTLDLLFYVTRPYTGFNETPALLTDRLGPLGWRSISCLLGRRAYVLVSTPHAPEFLRRP